MVRCEQAAAACLAEKPICVAIDDWPVLVASLLASLHNLVDLSYPKNLKDPNTLAKNSLGSGFTFSRDISGIFSMQPFLCLWHSYRLSFSQLTPILFKNQALGNSNTLTEEKRAIFEARFGALCSCIRYCLSQRQSAGRAVPVPVDQMLAFIARVLSLTADSPLLVFFPSSCCGYLLIAFRSIMPAVWPNCDRCCWQRAHVDGILNATELRLVLPRLYTEAWRLLSSLTSRQASFRFYFCHVEWFSVSVKTISGSKLYCPWIFFFSVGRHVVPYCSLIKRLFIRGLEQQQSIESAKDNIWNEAKTALFDALACCFPILAPTMWKDCAPSLVPFILPHILPPLPSSPPTPPVEPAQQQPVKHKRRKTDEDPAPRIASDLNNHGYTYGFGQQLLTRAAAVRALCTLVRHAGVWKNFSVNCKIQYP